MSYHVYTNHLVDVGPLPRLERAILDSGGWFIFCDVTFRDKHAVPGDFKLRVKSPHYGEAYISRLNQKRIWVTVHRITFTEHGCWCTLDPIPFADLCVDIPLGAIEPEPEPTRDHKL
jgi:hypothetical protein